MRSRIELAIADARANCGTLKRQKPPGISGFQLNSNGVQFARSMINKMDERAVIAPQVA